VDVYLNKAESTAKVHMTFIAYRRHVFNFIENFEIQRKSYQILKEKAKSSRYKKREFIDISPKLSLID